MGSPAESSRPCSTRSETVCDLRYDNNTLQTSESSFSELCPLKQSLWLALCVYSEEKPQCEYPMCGHVTRDVSSVFSVQSFQSSWLVAWRDASSSQGGPDTALGCILAV